MRPTTTCTSPTRPSQAAVDLSSRYIHDRFLPDKAVDLMDEAASRVRLAAQRPSADLPELEKQLDAIIREKEEAVNSQDFEQAAALGTGGRSSGKASARPGRTAALPSSGHHPRTSPPW